MMKILFPDLEKCGLRKLLEITCVWINPRGSGTYKFFQKARAIGAYPILVLTLFSMYFSGWEKSIHLCAYFFGVGLINNSQQIFFLTIQKDINKLFASLETFEKRRSQEDKAFFILQWRKNWKLVTVYWKGIVNYQVVCMFGSIVADFTLGNIFPGMPSIRIPIMLEGFIDTYGHRGLADLGFSSISLIWCYLTTLGNFGMEMGLILVVSFVRIEMKLICRRLEKLKSLMLTRHPDRRTCFKEAIIHYQQVLQMSDQMKNIYGIPIMIQNTVLSGCICLSMYQMTSTNTKEDLTVVFSAVYGLCILSGILFYTCKEGESLETQNNEILLALYDLPWDEEGPSFRRDLTMIIRQANKPYTISYHGSSALKMSSFMQTINRAYSYFAMLQSSMH